MASTITKYQGPAEFQIDGRTIAEARSVSIRVTKNNRRVYTMHKGMAGKSAGPEESEITTECAVPRAGYEKDFLDALQKGTELRCVHKSGGKRRTYAVTVDDYEENASADEPTAMRVMMSGPGPSVT